MLRDFSLAARNGFRGQSSLAGDRREGPRNSPGYHRGTGKSGEQLGPSPRLNNIQESGVVAAVALFSTAFPRAVEMLRLPICGSHT